MLLKIVVCTIGFLISVNVSIAQDISDETLGRMVSDDAALEAIRLGLSKIHTVKCEADKPCEPANAAELASPPIKIVDGRAAMVFAIKSALAQWCGLDWKRSFLPMIAFGKDRMRYSDRQMNLMALIHGDFYVRQYAFYSKTGQQCPASLRERLDAQLPKM